MTFKKGDRVRALESSGGGAFIKGNLYQVNRLDDEKWVKIFANERGQADCWRIDAFELADQPERGFKVGDQVRVVRHCNYEGYPISLDLPVGAEALITQSLKLLRGKGIDAFMLEGGVNFYTPLNLELVASASPIRAVTRREIVPGMYGELEIFDDATAILNDTTCPAALREAARIFTEIADALDENMRAAA